MQPTAPHPFLWGANKEIVTFIGKHFPEKFYNVPNHVVQLFNLGVWRMGKFWAESKISTDFQSVPCSLLFLSLSLWNESGESFIIPFFREHQYKIDLFEICRYISITLKSNFSAGRFRPFTVWFSYFESIIFPYKIPH